MVWSRIGAEFDIELNLLESVNSFVLSRPVHRHRDILALALGRMPLPLLKVVRSHLILVDGIHQRSKVWPLAFHHRNPHIASVLSRPDFVLQAVVEDALLHLEVGLDVRVQRWWGVNMILVRGIVSISSLS